MSGYFLSADADDDLQSIYLYSEEIWGERQAERYLAGLYDLFDHIGRNPKMGRLRTELGPGLRSFFHGSHVVFFMPWRGEIAIVRVLHGSIDFENAFEDYDPFAGIAGGQK